MNDIKTSQGYPLLPMRGLSVFPGMIINFEVIRPMSVAALNCATNDDQMIFMVAQKDITKERPDRKDLYEIGTVCRIKQVLKVPNSEVARVLAEGVSRARIVEYDVRPTMLYAQVEAIDDKPANSTSRGEALVRQCVALFDDYSHASGSLPPEMLAKVLASDDPAFIADYIAQNIYLQPEKKQKLLEEVRPLSRIRLLNQYLAKELEIIELEHRISDETRRLMSKNQREFFLREQMKAIQNELGETDDAVEELDEYRDKILSLNLPDEVETKLLKELNRLSKQPMGTADGAVLRTYLDTCLDLPWNVRTKDTADVKKTRDILEKDHFGLDKVKQRIVEYIAVKQLAPDIKGTVLCLVGPPGTGKTSIAMSVAKAMNRKQARISLGGVHDEAEIRGHRKTYVGAMPGRIIAGIIQAKSENPVLVLDEIDKLGNDYKGDPSSALLEALDAEQNYAFRDHYLEVPFDLSNVLFITTANTTDTIPRALLDRMEVIEVSGYTDEEKLQIAKRHLIPKQRGKHGLANSQLKFSDDAIREIISLYTRESGVRILERELASICRKTATRIADGECKSVSLKAGMVEKLLGTAKYKPDEHRKSDEVGLVRGLAWTSAGGAVLDVEAGVMEGTGKLELTGNLGDVMKESAKAAVSYIRSRADLFGIDHEFYKNKDIHIHFPEGAIPKDGPSAGITICVAVISALTGIPVRSDVAMTGEISLRGRIMAIGGLREKTMAALRAGVKTVIIPADNEKDLDDIDQTVRKALNFVVTDHADKALEIALSRSVTVEAQTEDIFVPDAEEKRSRSAKLRQ
jgi:ATP-dependent Lon protease